MLKAFYKKTPLVFHMCNDVNIREMIPVLFPSLIRKYYLNKKINDFFILKFLSSMIAEARLTHAWPYSLFLHVLLYF